MQRVFLIGYRGSGKTTVARLLAQKLGWEWCDADVVLEQRYRKAIHQIFAEEGEAAFRDKEAEVLDGLARLDRHVVATGGGIVLRPENQAKLRSGNVVWLTAPAEVLWERLQQDRTTGGRRPNLAQGGLAEVEEYLRMRAPLYEACADWVVDSTTKSAVEVAEAIHQWLSK